MPRLTGGPKPLQLLQVGTTGTVHKHATIIKGRCGASNSIHINLQVNSFFSGAPRANTID